MNQLMPDEPVPPRNVPLDAETMRAIEAIVLVAVEPVPTEQLAQLLEQSIVVIDRLCSELATRYSDAGHGFQLVKVAGGYRYQTHPDLSPYVERFLLDGQQARLSQAALETLAVVAYRQPVTRARVSAVRGVNVDGVVRTLLARGLIADAGQDADSAATLFRTTALFLERLGLRSLDDLPPLAPLLPELDELDDASTST